MACSGARAQRRVPADDAVAGELDFDPGVEVALLGELSSVGVVAADEARVEAEHAACLEVQAGDVAASAAPARERSFARLRARASARLAVDARAELAGK